jgi:polysaccharide export outer membrane protein
MKATSILATAAVCGLLQGCMLSPGQHMSRPSFPVGNAVASEAVELVPVTTDVLMDLLRTEQADVEAASIPQELLAYQPQPYRIGAGDTLYITVWEHPELTSPAGQQTPANGRLVHSDGTLFYPYVGELKVEGMTIGELRRLIESRLGKYIVRPQVDVGVIDYGSQRIFLQGAFQNTTPQPITALPMTLAQALGTAGIDNEKAYSSGLALTRDGREYVLDLEDLNAGAQGAAPNIYLKSDDHLFMPFNDRKEAYVLGEVNRPQSINFKSSRMTLTQALGRAGGLNGTTAKGKAVYVVRGSDELASAPAKVYQLDFRSPAAYALADSFMIRSGDVVFVGPAGVTRWNRLFSQILPFSGLIRNAAGAQNDVGR